MGSRDGQIKSLRVVRASVAREDVHFDLVEKLTLQRMAR